MLMAGIYGLSRMAGLPTPSKLRVTGYISDILKFVDEDDSGSVDYLELKDYVDSNMEI